MWMRSGKEIRRYVVASSVTGWAHTQNATWFVTIHKTLLQQTLWSCGIDHTSVIVQVPSKYIQFKERTESIYQAYPEKREQSRFQVVTQIFLVPCPCDHGISYKSVQMCFCCLQIRIISQKTKVIWNYPEIFMNIHLSVFCNVAHSHTNVSTKQHRWKHSIRRSGEVMKADVYYYGMCLVI